MNYVIGLVGKPAVGKSTLGSRLSNELGISHLNKDEFRRFFISHIKYYNDGFYYDTNPQIKSINRVLRPMTDKLIKELLDAKQNIIIDGYGKNKKSRDHYIELLKEYDIKIILVYIKSDENIILDRLSKRDKDQNTKWVESFHSRWNEEFDVPNSNESDYFIETNDINEAFEKIRRIINK